jgi:hypothetical protein
MLPILTRYKHCSWPQAFKRQNDVSFWVMMVVVVVVMTMMTLFPSSWFGEKYL